MKRIITLILLCAFASVCGGQTIPDIPQEVRFAVGMVLAASNTDGNVREAALAHMKAELRRQEEMQEMKDKIAALEAKLGRK